MSMMELHDGRSSIQVNEWWWYRIHPGSSDDLRLQLEAAVYGIGVALLPEPIVAASVRSGALEVVLPLWSAANHIIHLLYPPPRGMLPSVRSLIDYLAMHLPASIQERSVEIH